MARAAIWQTATRRPLNTAVFIGPLVVIRPASSCTWSSSAWSAADVSTNTNSDLAVPINNAPDRREGRCTERSAAVDSFFHGRLRERLEYCVRIAACQFGQWITAFAPRHCFSGGLQLFWDGERYRTHVRWLRESRFLRDLERDNIDNDVVDEELDTLRQDDSALTRRERVVKFLRSNQVQMFLCTIVLVDACIIVAQILLDINSVKDRLIERDEDLSQLITYLSDYHQSYKHDFTQMLRLLSPPPMTSSTNYFRQEMRPAPRADDGVRVTSASSSGDDVFLRTARAMHFVSIAILSFLLVEEVVRITAMGRFICSHKVELFDLVIIFTSFIVDVVFIGGVSGDDGQKAAAALIVLLVWRVARVVDGIITTVKQRQEFRIRLQRRARRRVEKMLEAADDERQRQIAELEALRQLCVRTGVSQKDISSICLDNKSGRQLPRMLQAFTSVARLSFSMTLLSRPSSPLSAGHTPPTRHPSDGLLSRYRVDTSGEWNGSPGRGLDLGPCWRPLAAHRASLSPPRPRSRSDGSAYCRPRIHREL